MCEKNHKSVNCAFVKSVKSHKIIIEVWPSAVKKAHIPTDSKKSHFCSCVDSLHIKTLLAPLKIRWDKEKSGPTGNPDMKY
jgi:hypothetical protein